MPCSVMLELKFYYTRISFRAKINSFLIFTVGYTWWVGRDSMSLSKITTMTKSIEVNSLILNVLTGVFVPY